MMIPEDFSRFFDDQGQNAAQSPLRAYFPVSVIERLRASSVAPSRLFGAELKRLETEPEAEPSFTLDLARLLGDAGGFDWPVNDLGRCLALAVFHEHAKQLFTGPGPDKEALDDADRADWWKSA
jgi:hypothetical protein